MFTINEQAVLSGRLDGYLRWAARAVVGASVACLFLLYCYYLTLQNRTTPLEYLTVRILVGITGAAGGLGGTLIWKAMWIYWKKCDTTPKRFKRLWLLVMSLFPPFGSTAYYHLVYRRLLDSTEEGSKPAA
jgi:hypothetical protein